MQSIANALGRFRAAFLNFDAWLFVGLGILMFASRLPLPADMWINLPHAATIVQTAGLMFAIWGFQIMGSMFMWPSFRLGPVIGRAMSGCVASAILCLALFLFNGLSTLAFAVWLSGALGQVAGGQ